MTEIEIRFKQSFDSASLVSEKVQFLLSKNDLLLSQEVIQTLSSSLKELILATSEIVDDQFLLATLTAFEEAGNKGEPHEACMLLLEGAIECFVQLELEQVNSLVQSITIAKKVIDMMAQSSTFHETVSTLKSFLAEWNEIIKSLDNFNSKLINPGERNTNQNIMMSIYICLKHLVENLAETAIYPLSKHTKYSRKTLVEMIEALLDTLMSHLRTPKSNGTIIVDDGSSNFVSNIDRLLDQLSKTVEFQDLQDIESLIAEVVKHSEEVALAVDESDGSILRSFNEKVLSEFQNLSNLLESSKSPTTDSAMACDYTADFLELLEQQVNVCLLRLILDTFSTVNDPIENALKGERVLLTLTEHKLNLAAKLTIQATSSVESIVHIRSFTWFLQHVVGDLQRLFEDSRRDEEKIVCLLRLWKSDIAKLVKEIEALVDPCAFAQVVERTLRKRGEHIKAVVAGKKTGSLKIEIRSIISEMSYFLKFLTREQIVDAATLEVLPVADVNIAFREVKAAFTLLESGTCQSSLNSLVKRIEVLVSIMEQVVDVLVKHSDEDGTIPDIHSSTSTKSLSTTTESEKRKRRKSASTHAISFARSLQKFPEDFKLLPIDINTPAPKPAPKLRRSSSAFPPTPKLTSPYRLKASSATELSSLILQTKGSSQIMPDKTGASLQLNLTEMLEDLSRIQNSFTSETSGKS
ncbi:uncharacterized protein LOC136042311 isoform X1 [Artemia franciscana]